MYCNRWPPWADCRLIFKRCGDFWYCGIDALKYARAWQSLTTRLVVADEFNQVT